MNVYTKTYNTSVNDGVAEYVGKNINVYLNKINKILDLNEKSLFSRFEKIIFKNLVITQIILHEIKHANQKKKIENDNDIEASI